VLQEADGIRARRREPAINAPLVVTGLILALLAAHGARVWTGTTLDPLAVTSDDFAHGGYAQFVTYQFAHGSWAHVLMNSAFVLYFGTGARGSLTFLLFFLVCGVLAAATYGIYVNLEARVMAKPPPPWALVGASGAASGLMGAAARLMQGHGRVGQLGGRTVVVMTLAWILINLVLGLSGLTPGAGAVPVAWQAHILGFFAGLLLISPFAAIAGASRRHQPLP
jgi:membrane associated rhomboid family serine protease